MAYSGAQMQQFLYCDQKLNLAQVTEFLEKYEVEKALFLERFLSAFHTWVWS